MYITTKNNYINLRLQLPWQDVCMGGVSMFLEKRQLDVSYGNRSMVAASKIG